jgi:hypothetical protein
VLLCELVGNEPQVVVGTNGGAWIAYGRVGALKT